MCCELSGHAVSPQCVADALNWRGFLWTLGKSGDFPRWQCGQMGRGSFQVSGVFPISVKLSCSDMGNWLCSAKSLPFSPFLPLHCTLSS